MTTLKRSSVDKCHDSPNPGPTPFSSPAVFPSSSLSKDLLQLQLNQTTNESIPSLLDRVRRFLPEIQAANDRLEESDRMEIAEADTEDQPAIDMNLLVGVFDAKPTADVEATTDAFLGRGRSSKTPYPGIQEIYGLVLDMIFSKSIMSIHSALSCLSKGDLSGAISIADQSLVADPSNSYARQFRAWVHQLQGGSAISLALCDYLECRKDRPNDPSVLIDRAIANISVMKEQLAISDLTQAMLLPNAPSFAYWLRAHAYRRIGQLDASEADLNIAIQQDPNNLDYRVSRADLLRIMSLNDGAKIDVDFVLERQPDNKHAKQIDALISKPKTVQHGLLPKRTKPANRVFEQLLLGNYDAVISCCTDTPEDASLLMAKSLALIATGKLHKALECVNRGLILSPATAVLFYIRGRILKLLDRPSEALVNFRQAIDIDETFEVAGKACQHIQRYLDAIIKLNVQSEHHKKMQSWSCEQVSAWLRLNHVNAENVRRFKEFEIDGVTLSHCDDNDLLAIGVKAGFVRRRILIAIENQRNKESAE